MISIYKTMIDYAYGTSDRYVTMVGRDGDGGYRAVPAVTLPRGQANRLGRTSGDAGNTNKTEQVPRPADRRRATAWSAACTAT